LSGRRDAQIPLAPLFRTAVLLGVGDSTMMDQNQRSAVPLWWLDRRCAVPQWQIRSTVCGVTTTTRWEGIDFHGESVVTVATKLIPSTTITTWRCRR
jgi:hypothetical protein